jgi:NADPH:quinone reductase-like Zn-dependent oxidoreductase
MVREDVMKAIVHERYGSPDVLELRDIDTPVLDDDSVLVRVRAASVNAYDWHMMRGLPFLVRMSEGLRRPKQTAKGVARCRTAGESWSPTGFS